MRSTKLLGLTMTLLLGACSSGIGLSPGDGSNTQPAAPVTTGSNEGGFGAPSQAPGEFDLGPGKAASGTLRLATDGCWYADLNGNERLVVLPTGFELDPAAGGELRGADGATYRDGDRFDATGSMVPGDAIPGGRDGRWGNYMTFCQPESDELAVFDRLAKEFDPADLSDAELALLVQQAVFTEHWPCGRGWAASTVDQRVGLVLYETSTATGDATDPIVLPDPGWSAEVRFGKNLFSEHCNDAIEDWTALPTIVTRWPLSAGEVTVADPIPAADEVPARVRAILEGGKIDTEAGSILLPRTELDNVQYNFFAG